MKLTYDDFKFYLGETIEYCQTIEHDIKWIYAVMRKGNENSNFDNISKQSLGIIVDKLEELDNSDSDIFLTEKDYALLRSIKAERNYLVHQIYRDFLYVDDCFTSREYEVACSRLMNFHNRIKKLQDGIEKTRLNAVKKYRR